MNNLVYVCTCYKNYMTCASENGGFSPQDRPPRFDPMPCRNPSWRRPMAAIEWITTPSDYLIANNIFMSGIRL